MQLPRNPWDYFHPDAIIWVAVFVFVLTLPWTGRYLYRLYKYLSRRGEREEGRIELTEKEKKRLERHRRKEIRRKRRRRRT